MKKWNFWIDCGGTFTDIIGIDGDGHSHTHKILSHSPHYESAVVEGIKTLLGHERFKEEIEQVRLGTTVATNAFLERSGLPCALITTQGHRDILEIRDQSRGDLFQIPIEKVKPFYEVAIEAIERMTVSGEVLTQLDEEDITAKLHHLKKRGIRSLAISLMHANQNSAHELAIESIAKNIGFDYISVSHQVSPRSHYVSRTETTVVDAYLSPYLQQYTQDLEEKLGLDNILYMKSDGGLCKGSELKSYNALLSGPAGGLVGAIEAAKEVGLEKIITFDMGGTSTDVAIYDGELALDHRPIIGGMTLLASMVDIHTVAAGGGSLLTHDGHRFQVGPESAGAFPGPACYGNGGKLTLTDANLFLGNIRVEGFPRVFGPDGKAPLDEKIVKEKFEELAREFSMDAKKIAQGFLDIAVETMARAIKKVSIERGHDPKDFALVSFGGAGGQMACQVAKRLQINRVFSHPYSSVLSALGIGQSHHSLSLQGKRSEGFDPLKEKLSLQLGQGEYKYSYFLTPPQSDYQAEFVTSDFNEACAEFRDHYKKIFGLELDGSPECETIAVRRIKKQDNEIELRVSDAKTIVGPHLISENNTTLVVAKGWEAQSDGYGRWMISHKNHSEVESKRDEKIELEIFYQRFQFIAEQMGFTLEKMARSVNIKERKDFSCALFSAQGELIANAPHIPVHLGSMGEVVGAVTKVHSPKEGEMYLCNSPLYGGTHLPDVTLVAPVFFDGVLVMWVASRGHHADIGGISPGSMPGGSTKLEEEGVIINPLKVVEEGAVKFDELKELLTKSKYPVRNLELNLHDIRAKVSANFRGIQDIVDLYKQYGNQYVSHMAEKILDYSHQKIVESLKGFDHLTGNKKIAKDREIFVEVSRLGEQWVFNFEGTSKAQANNFNTPKAVVKAAILFVLRCTIEDNIPLNDGLMRAVDIRVPKDCFLNPGPSDAVVAGNVESSMAICDVLFATLGIMADSQGTMNNVSFGNRKYQYYETLAGGSGATRDFKGTDAIQVHMTNSLLTDPEVMEERFPIRVSEMSIRRNSGGEGKHRGGDGIQRALTFLEDMQVSMISQGRDFPPQGLDGGGAGKRGENIKVYEGRELKLSENFETQFCAGSQLIIRTPGGGGYGIMNI